jgi:hypothetical protein
MITIENLPSRLQALIDCSKVGTGCWLWNGRLNDDGYGMTSINDRNMGAHRATTLLLTGDVGSELDHLCRTRRCVNPLHLESISHRENVLRGEGVAAKYARRNHCKYGHEFTPENTRMYGNARVCLTCKKQKDEESFVRIHGPRTGKSGAFNGRAKITETDIPGIRADSRSQSIIASEYGITQTTVSAIKRRKLWAHIS